MPPLRVLLAAAGWLCVPVVSSLRFNLRQFGGMGDNRTLNTGAFEAGVAAVREAGGGQLYVPPGIYVTTGFALASNMSLFLEAGATIVGLAEFQPVPGSSPPQLLATNWRPRNDSCVSRTLLNAKKAIPAPAGSTSATLVSSLLLVAGISLTSRLQATTAASWARLAGGGAFGSSCSMVALTRSSSHAAIAWWCLT